MIDGVYTADHLIELDDKQIKSQPEGTKGVVLEFEGPVHYIMDQYHMLKYAKENDRAKEVLDSFCPFIDLNDQHNKRSAEQSDSELK